MITAQDTEASSRNVRNAIAVENYTYDNSAELSAYSDAIGGNDLVDGG